MFESIKKYINDKESKMIIFSNYINIVNYKKIISLEEDYISVLTNNNRIIIKGEKLTLQKLLENEVLIKGNVNSIEVDHNE